MKLKINRKIIFITFLISLPFWWGMNALANNLGDFFFWSELSKRPEIFTAEIAPKTPEPRIVKNAEPLKLEAKSAISLFFNDYGKIKPLFEKDIKKVLPIASLSKLMTAKIVLETYDLSKEVTISNEAIAQEGEFGQLKAGETFTVQYLLYPLLMESSNDAAFALADDYEDITSEHFVKLMNREATKLNLENTSFVDVTGLSPQNGEPKEKTNLSTSYDLALFTKSLLDKKQLWDILSLPQYELYGPVLINTNKLLFDNSNGWKDEILGGKTGYTQEAGQCLLLVLKAPRGNGYIVNVVLGSSDRFEEMKQLITWIKSAYIW